MEEEISYIADNSQALLSNNK